jgi:hypothetical protein
MADAVDHRIQLGTTVRCQGKLQAANAEFSRSAGDTTAAHIGEEGGGGGGGALAVAMEISVYRLVPVEDPNEEPLHWLQCEQLWETEYTRHAAGAHYDRRHIDRTLARMAAASAPGGSAAKRRGGGT